MINTICICSETPFDLEKIGFSLRHAADLLCDPGQTTSLVETSVSEFVSDELVFMSYNFFSSSGLEFFWGAGKFLDLGACRIRRIWRYPNSCNTTPSCRS